MNTVLRLQVRRDRIQLTIWFLALVGLVAGSASAVASTYNGAAERVALLRLAIAQPAVLALRGAPNGGSLGSLLWFELFAWLALVLGLMNTFLAVRHGRGDEEAGRRELLAGTAVHRTTSIGATIALGVLANSVIGTGMGLAFLAAGFSGSEIVLACAAFALIGLAFLGVGLLVGELAPTSRSANGIAAAVVTAAYLGRAIGDASGTADLHTVTLTAGWVSWLSPIGWGEQMFVFTADRAWPLACMAALFVVTAGAAVAIRSRRDLGASLLRERPGRARAIRVLAGPLGLQWRLAWPAIAAWAFGGLALGVLIGTLGPAVSSAVTADATMRRMLEALGHTRGDLVTLFAAAVLSMAAILAAAAGIQSALHARAEEESGRAESVLAAPVSRTLWLGATAVVSWVAVLAPLAAAAAGGSIGLAVGGETDSAVRVLGQAAVEAPAALVVAGIALLLVGLVPRLATGVSWSVLGLAGGLSLFGALLNVPEAVRNLSPFSVVPGVPVTDWGDTVALASIAVALPIIAIVVFRNRNVPA